ncbi:hypothetical protein [Phytomonospora endophytica]|uniref:Uncharacterized protein n=1 Tax=Phytomonospora endophytica TaxID=714109 RepID=A0A841FSP0_9ACTN|nr:hypothetical protein [Phytomonospora endophytica]MBB6036327.1 hypothetical protein [Phytomonospora endophytica]GIG67234.1 hypothetical protein Pen01_35290 [Phytomonospora endophytica]
MPDPASFHVADNWAGFYYELAVDLGSTDDARLDEALKTMWSAAGVEGCFGRHGQAEEWTPTPCTVASLTEYGSLDGRVRLPTGERVVCTCMAVRGGGYSDWLDFCLPTGALDNAKVPIWGDGVHEVEPDHNVPLNDWLADIARQVFARVPFSLALTGVEASGADDAENLAGRAPDRRGHGYLLPRGEVLDYFPPNV